MARATKKQVLGRGLTSILKDSKNKSTNISNVTNKVSSEVDISKISLNPFQPRSSFDREKLDELVISIKNLELKPISISSPL